jgi:hypothetical protein
MAGAEAAHDGTCGLGVGRLVCLLGNKAGLTAQHTPGSSCLSCHLNKLQNRSMLEETSKQTLEGRDG